MRFEYNAFLRIGTPGAYEGPHILIKEGAVGGQVWAAFTESPCTFRDSVTGIRAPSSDKSLLKACTAYLNSSLATYYLFMTTGWGIDRKRVKRGEALSLPAMPLHNADVVAELAALYDELTADGDRGAIEQLMDRLVFKAFGVTKSEQTLVKDAIDTSIDIIHNRTNSRALLPPSREQLAAYAEAFSSVFGRMLSAGGRGLVTTIYSGDSPLSLVSFSVVDTQKARVHASVLENGQIDGALRALSAIAYQREGVNLYRRRHMQIYEESTVNIIKPAEARFWTQSAGLHDADETIGRTLAETVHATA